MGHERTGEIPMMQSHSAPAHRVIDLHTHFMPLDLPNLAVSTGDQRWPRLVVNEDGTSGRVLQGDDVFRVVRPPCWKPESRLAEMDRIGIDVQVLSPIPISLTYWADALPSRDYARHINDWLADTVQKGRGRLRGLGTVPLQDPAMAIEEMKRVVIDLELDGLEIGTTVDGVELDANELRPFFRAADELGVPIFIHPTDGRCATRVHTDEAIAFGLGMLTDSALAATALVFGGVLSECPNLRVCLSHGGGTFPWAFPRLNLFDAIGGLHQESRCGHPTAADLTARLWVDSLVFDPEHLRLLLSRFGSDHIVVGSDYPFFPLEPAPQAILGQAVDLGAIAPEQAERMQSANALAFLGLEAELSPSAITGTG